MAQTKRKFRIPLKPCLATPSTVGSPEYWRLSLDSCPASGQCKRLTGVDNAVTVNDVDILDDIHTQSQNIIDVHPTSNEANECEMIIDYNSIIDVDGKTSNAKYGNECLSKKFKQSGKKRSMDKPKKHANNTDKISALEKKRMLSETARNGIKGARKSQKCTSSTQNDDLSKAKENKRDPVKESSVENVYVFPVSPKVVKISHSVFGEKDKIKRETLDTIRQRYKEILELRERIKKLRIPSELKTKLGLRLDVEP